MICNYNVQLFTEVFTCLRFLAISYKSHNNQWTVWGIEIQYEICILCIATGKMDALTPKSWVKGHGDIIPHALSGEHVDNLWTLTWAKNGRPREEIRFISILGRDRNENLLMIFFCHWFKGSNLTTQLLIFV